MLFVRIEHTRGFCSIAERSDVLSQTRREGTMLVRYYTTGSLDMRGSACQNEKKFLFGHEYSRIGVAGHVIGQIVAELI